MKRILLLLSFFLVSISAVAAGATRLPFIQDDFAKARGQALGRKTPIFVEVWAPW